MYFDPAYDPANQHSLNSVFSLQKSRLHRRILGNGEWFRLEHPTALPIHLFVMSSKIACRLVATMQLATHFKLLRTVSTDYVPF